MFQCLNACVISCIFCHAAYFHYLFLRECPNDCKHLKRSILLLPMWADVSDVGPYNFTWIGDTVYSMFIPTLSVVESWVAKNVSIEYGHDSYSVRVQVTPCLLPLSCAHLHICSPALAALRQSCSHVVYLHSRLFFMLSMQPMRDIVKNWKGFLTIWCASGLFWGYDWTLVLGLAWASYYHFSSQSFLGLLFQLYYYLFQVVCELLLNRQATHAL